LGISRTFIVGRFAFEKSGDTRAWDRWFESLPLQRGVTCELATAFRQCPFGADASGSLDGEQASSDRVVADVVHRRRERRVARFNRYENLRVRFDCSRRIVAVQRAPFVEHMHEGPEERKERNVRAFKL